MKKKKTLLFYNYQKGRKKGGSMSLQHKHAAINKSGKNKIPDTHHFNQCDVSLIHIWK